MLGPLKKKERKGKHMRKGLKPFITAALGCALLLPAVLADAADYTKPVKIQDYLYETTCTNLNEKEGEDFTAKNIKNAVKAGCSSVRNGNFHGRNYDWNYDDTNEYVIHVPAEGGRHASVGVVSLVSGPDFMADSSKKPEDMLPYLPYMTLDGINDAHVVVNSNMSNSTYGPTTGSNPGKPRLNGMRVVRAILDNAGSVEEAVKLLQDHDVYMPAAFDLHYMISDPKETAVVEFINNKMHVDRNARVMTNYYVTLPYLQPDALGVERAEILKVHYQEGNTKDGMIKLMDRARASRVFEQDAVHLWVSEFAGSVLPGSDKKYTLLEADKIREYMVPYLAKHKRVRNSGSMWQTVHCSVFDIENLKLCVIAQENGIRHDFELKQK